MGAAVVDVVYSYAHAMKKEKLCAQFLVRVGLVFTM
jgi:hypothetical protein